MQRSDDATQDIIRKLCDLRSRPNYQTTADTDGITPAEIKQYVSFIQDPITRATTYNHLMNLVNDQKQVKVAMALLSRLGKTYGK
jgi:hypothetical protein